VLNVLTEVPGQDLTAAEIGGRLGGANRDSLYRALRRALALGVVAQRRHGRLSTYRINDRAPIYPELKALLSKLLGVGASIRTALGRFEPPAVEQAFIFGSAARAEDSYTSDVDLFVVGEITGLELARALGGVQEEHRREINVVAYAPDVVKARLDDRDPFFHHVWSQPKLFLVGEPAALPQADSA
jgi:predicted nucleotidyltransferase